MVLYKHPTQGLYSKNIYILNIIKHLLMARYEEASC